MRKSSTQKQKLYIKFPKSKNPEDETYIQKLQKPFQKKSKQNHYSNLLEKHKDNAKQQNLEKKYRIILSLKEKMLLNFLVHLLMKIFHGNST